MITYVHTMLKSHKYTKMSKCLVVCPLNTVLNWVNEFEIWLADVDFEIEVRFEPPHDKTNKMISVPSKDSDQPGQSAQSD